MDKVIPVLSLVVAALAVFVGPFISMWATKRQISASLEVANKEIIAPMRQAWINNLRDLLAELASSSLHYHVAGVEERTDEEYRRLILLEHKAALMLNRDEPDHRRLEELVRNMISAIERGRDGEQDFVTIHPAVIELSRQILKREWNRVRDPIQLA